MEEILKGMFKMENCTAANIVILATLDTKADEAGYLKELIQARGHHALLIDVGIKSKPGLEPDFTHDQVAAAAGLSMAEIRGSDNEGEAISAMALGAAALMGELISRDRIDGLLAIGGSMGTSLGLQVMRELPVTIPKLMLSSIAFTSMVTTEAVSIDQVMMQTVGDLWGLNPVTRRSLRRAAGAICGMVETAEEETATDKAVIAITILGVHDYANRCRSLLQERGYEPVFFHAVGTGACDKLIRQGYIDALLELAPYELINQVCGGSISGGQEKINAACQEGIPQVITPGALDFFTWAGSGETIPPQFRDRKLHMHNPLVYLIGTTLREKEKIALELLERVNRARGPTTLLIPLQGFSCLDGKEGLPFYDPQAAPLVSRILREGVNNSLVRVVETDAHINDPVFIEQAVALLQEMME